MRVVFDGICLGDGPITGVARCFLTGLEAYANGFADDCVLLLPAGASAPDLPGVRVVASPRGALRRQLQLPRLLRSLGADVLHSSVAAVPLRARCATIATVHDLPWLHPDIEEPDSRWRRLATMRSLRAATAVLAPSSMTRDDAASLLGDQSTNVWLVPHGCRLGPEPSPRDTDARGGPLLVLGDDRQRKNRPRLQAAHASARERCRDLPALQFVGPPEHYVSEVDKLALLRTCRALVHVSLFEGFGMPVLEALAHAAPVLCSDLPPLREIAGQHAEFVDPRSVEAIADGLLRVHADAPLRRMRAAAGHRRAESMQPEHVAANWHRIHGQVAS